MSRKREPFRFKQFSVNHNLSSIKIGVDAVILGAWANPEGDSILDIGCGCGVISLMIAQRNPYAAILGIDIHNESVTEADGNFQTSPWSDRLKAEYADFMTLPATHKFDLLISNPPYFDSGIANPYTPRLKARHESELSPGNILRKGLNFLNEEGRIALVIQAERETELIGEAKKLGYITKRLLRVAGSEGKPAKRSFIEFIKGGNSYIKTPLESQLINIQYRNGTYTQEYHELCKDFYINF